MNIEIIQIYPLLFCNNKNVIIRIYYKTGNNESVQRNYRLTMLAIHSFIDWYNTCFRLKDIILNRTYHNYSMIIVKQQTRKLFQHYSFLYFYNRNQYFLNEEFASLQRDPKFIF